MNTLFFPSRTFHLLLYLKLEYIKMHISPNCRRWENVAHKIFPVASFIFRNPVQNCSNCVHNRNNVKNVINICFNCPGRHKTRTARETTGNKGSLKMYRFLRPRAVSEIFSVFFSRTCPAHRDRPCANYGNLRMQENAPLLFIQ